MPLHIIRENFVNRLRLSVGENQPKYFYNKPWLHEAAGGVSTSLLTSIEPADKLELLQPDGEDLRDVENSIRLHKALGMLTPVQARDPRLWTRLAHVEFWAYMRSRWNVERFKDDTQKMRQFIITRYFVAQNQSRALLRNGIARLWWYAKVTFDPERRNPYELTAVLLDKLDITQQILERNLGRSPQVLNGYCEFLLRHGGELLGSGDGKRTRIRHLAKYLNLYGGVTLLDCLNRTEIIDILEAEYSRISQHPELIETS